MRLLIEGVITFLLAPRMRTVRTVRTQISNGYFQFCVWWELCCCQDFLHHNDVHLTVVDFLFPDMKGGFLNSIKANPEAFRSAFAGGKPKERASKARESESKYFHSSGLPADIAAELASIGFDNPKRVELPTASEMAQMGNVDIAAELAKHGMTMMNHDILKEDVYDKMNAPMKFATKRYLL